MTGLQQSAKLSCNPLIIYTKNVMLGFWIKANMNSVNCMAKQASISKESPVDTSLFLPHMISAMQPKHWQDRIRDLSPLSQKTAFSRRSEIRKMQIPASVTTYLHQRAGCVLVWFYCLRKNIHALKQAVRGSSGEDLHLPPVPQHSSRPR